MKRENLYEPFSISFETMDQYTKPKHKNTFFELVYVWSGSGTQYINGCEFNYYEGHLFLLAPSDYYSFAIATTTEFFFLRFNDIYIKETALSTENIERIKDMLQDANHLPGCILGNQLDRDTVRPMIEAIIRESENKDIYYKELVQQFVITIIIIVARNISKFSSLKVTENTEEKAMDILQYIQTNIYFPDKILAESLSKHFRISTAYLGRYFKKHTNETMQHYITHYKIKLIENRLKFSDKRINEIASDFGFSDVSHFNKFFRKQIGMSPSEFRKDSRSNVL